MARIILISIIFFFAHVVVAQNNPYKIDDRLYPLYVKADSARYTKDGVRLANELYDKAVKLGDKKAECLAYTVHVHYAHDNNPKELKKNVDKLMRLSRKNGYLQYYYFGWVIYINWLLAQNETYEALQEAYKLSDQSKKDNDTYGISTSYKMLGNLYWARGNYDKAYEFYSEGLEYSKKYDSKQDPMVYYAMLAKYYRNKRDFHKAIAMCDAGLACATADRSRIDLLVLKGLVYNDWAKPREMAKVCAEVERLGKKVVIGDNMEYKKLQAMVAASKGDYPKAHSIARTITIAIDSVDCEQYVYEREGKMKEALDCQKKLYGMYVTRVSQVQASDLAKISTLFNNERIKAKAREEQEVLKHKFRFTLSLIGLAVLVAIIIVQIYSRRKAKNFIKQLTHKNEELEIACDKAEESGRLKTTFIQNMTHEIRTPLNAILGFTDVLLDPDAEIENEEKTEFRQIIRHNANLLTGLINDILTLSELQSGKSRVNLAEVKCNNLCRMALTTVEHRKPKDVDLLFTTDVEDDMTINTDERRVTQVIVNFLTNAEKYTTEGSITLDCSVSKYPGYITFTVTDTGCGIPEEKQMLIFGRFEKLDDFHQGLGLGLNICALIAGMLNASIGVDPNYHDGARFYFSLPLEKQ